MSFRFGRCFHEQLFRFWCLFLLIITCLSFLKSFVLNLLFCLTKILSPIWWFLSWLWYSKTDSCGFLKSSTIWCPTLTEWCYCIHGWIYLRFPIDLFIFPPPQYFPWIRTTMEFFDLSIDRTGLWWNPEFFHVALFGQHEYYSLGSKNLSLSIRTISGAPKFITASISGCLMSFVALDFSIFA